MRVPLLEFASVVQGLYLLAETTQAAGQVTVAAAAKIARQIIRRAMLANAHTERRHGVRMRRPEKRRLHLFE